MGNTYSIAMSSPKEAGFWTLHLWNLKKRIVFEHHKWQQEKSMMLGKACQSLTGLEEKKQ